MKKIILLLLIFLTGLAQYTIAENKHIMDSLKLALSKVQSDTVRLRLHWKLCEECDVKNNLIYAEPLIKLADKLLLQTKDEKQRKIILRQKANAMGCIQIYYEQSNNTINYNKYAFKRLDIYKSINDTINIVDCVHQFGNYYDKIKDYSKCLDWINYGLSLSLKYKYKIGIGISYHNKGQLFQSIGEYNESIINLQKALVIFEELKDTSWMRENLTAIGEAYKKLNNTQKSLEYFEKALSVSSGSKSSEIIPVYQRIGILYLKNKNYKLAIKYFEKALMIAVQIKDYFWMSSLTNSIGNVYFYSSNLDSALTYQLQALKIVTSNDNKGTEIEYSIARTYFKLKKYKEAKVYCEKAIINSQTFPGFLSVVEQLGSRIDSASGNYKSAFEHYQKCITLQDKINGDEVSKAAALEKFQSDLQNQKAIDKAVSEKEIEKQKIVRNSFIGGFILVMLIAIGIFRSLQQNRKAKTIIEKQKKEVEHQKQEILDSIEYAKRIQSTILPPPKVVKKYLDDSFILYLPKDIVAGDFYWMETVGDWVLFAACDCTGHGVPGALVSVVCHNALNRAVKEYNKIMPSEILDCVAELVLENFSSDDDVKDGMDASVCSLNTATGELFWAGANNPLWLIRHAELNSSPVEIIEYKPNKQPIGKFDDRVPYTNHKIEIAKGDTIYLFTDGYADQFGGEKGKKLTKVKFKEAILNMQRYNLDEQKKYLLDLHLNYKGNLGQVDDICVIGVRV